MQEKKDIVDYYDKIATNYAAKTQDEFAPNQFERVLIREFALEVLHRGKVIDVGCGSGQITDFLSKHKITDLVGIDMSSQMIHIAKEQYPLLQFEVADLQQLPYPDHSFGAVLAFYSMIHFDEEQLKIAFQEIKRTLSANGQFLLAFHTGNSIRHLDQYVDHAVSIDFYFYEIGHIMELLMTIGFEIIDVMEQPNPSALENGSKRAYIWSQYTS
ncbi:class I SAM-dependent methyltransferase [Cytophagaceae bacterium YF14B1]|uniref:Class I SAM-dependent methyltransferase n=1 Tax=Xanthocytophaga flava TaxID=3048013 RepID=A0AAE3QK95_9BACT|nr:class I SAM-dependent methyltransferase [Xanthocytophaga flavus]MDJ1480927.1 class I SAM-dependent methyltransferase [Xanthocytophaga flavus]